jgi:hypothetical protein
VIVTSFTEGIAGIRSCLLAQKLPHRAKELILSVQWELVDGVREHDHPAVWNLSAEMLDFLLVIFPLCFQKFQDVLSLSLRQRLSPVNVLLVTDGEKRERRRFNFGVFVRS